MTCVMLKSHFFFNESLLKKSQTFQQGPLMLKDFFSKTCVADSTQYPLRKRFVGITLPKYGNKKNFDFCVWVELKLERTFSAGKLNPPPRVLLKIFAEKSKKLLLFLTCDMLKSHFFFSQSLLNKCHEKVQL